MKENRIAQLERNLVKVYIVSFFRYFLLFLPVVVPYFSSLGLSSQEILTLQSAAAFTIFVFEVPTGYIADNFKRKWSMICAAILRIAAMFCLVRAENFQGLLLFEVLFSLSLCFDSGTDTAILYDTYSELKELREDLNDENTSKILGSKVFFMQIGEAVSAIFGGALATFSLKHTVYGNFAVSFIPFLICLTLIEPNTASKTNSSEAPEQRLLPKLVSTFSNSSLMSCLALLIFINLLTFIATWTFQINWKHNEIDVKYFGYLWATYNVVVALSARIAPRLETWVGSKGLIAFTGCLPALGFLGMCYANTFCALIAGLAIQICRGLQEVTIRRVFNDQVPAKIRATANSVISLGIRGSFALTAPLFGYLIDQQGIRVSYFWLGIGSFIGFWGIFYFLNKHQFKKEIPAAVQAQAV